MPIRRDEHYEVVGVAVAGPRPLTSTWIELESGVTAIYGKNGAGKSRLLHAIGEACIGVRSDRHSSRELFVRVLDPDRHVPSPGQDLVGRSLHALLMAATSEALLAEKSLDLEPHHYDPLSYSHVSCEILMAGDGLAIDELEIGHIANAGLLGYTSGSNGPLCCLAVDESAWISERLRRIFEHETQILVFRTGTDEPRAYPILMHLPRSAFNLVHLDPIHWWIEYSQHRSLEKRIEIEEDGMHEYLCPESKEGPIAGPMRATVEHTPVRLLDADGTSFSGLSNATLEALQSIDNPGVYFHQREFLEHFRANYAPTIASAVDEDGVTLNDRAAERLAELSTWANLFYGVLYPDPPELVFDLGTADTWVLGHPAQWTAVISGGRKVPLSGLSDAEARFASLAIQASLALASKNDFPVVLTVDEPERGLHPSAVNHVLAGLKHLSTELGGAAVIVTTHSPAILADAGVRTMRVWRDSDGMSRVESFPALPAKAEAEEWLAELGLDYKDLAALTRVWLLVEGSHDETVMREFFADELAEGMVQILCMRGAKKLEPSTLELIARTSDAKYVVMLDNTKDEAQLAEDFLEASSYGQPTRDLEKQLARHRSIEAESLLSLVKALEGPYSAEMVSFVGLERRDIIDYLHPAGFGLDISWEELRRLHDESGDRRDFKTWVKEEYNTPIGQNRIAAVASDMRRQGVIPDELREACLKVIQASLGSSVRALDSYKPGGTI